VRDVLRPRFEKTFDDAGYVLVGWGDVGLDHLMSKGFPVKSPADLNGRRAWVWREDLVLPAVFEAAGAVPVPTSTFEAITELSTGRVTVVSVSALAAAELQWSSRLDHVTALVVAPSVGGLVLSKARLDALTPEQRAIVVDTGRVASKTLCDRMRKEDADALARLKKRMTYVEATPAELQAWEALFTDARARLTKGPLSPALVKEVEGLLAR
jgi:TRAP-type C4-dicarboxylate transport system substrate-binding protein